MPSRKHGVLHIADPNLEKRSDEMKASRGAWDFVPGLRPTQVKPLTDQEKELLAYSEAGKNSAEIAELLGGGWNHQRVSATLSTLKKRRT